jgi:hypothetical protein
MITSQLFSSVFHDIGFGGLETVKFEGLEFTVFLNS